MTEPEFLGAWMVLPWQDVPLFMPTEARAQYLVVVKPGPLTARASDFLDLNYRIRSEEVRLRGTLFRDERHDWLIYAAPDETRVEPAMARLGIAISFFAWLERVVSG